MPSLDPANEKPSIRVAKKVASAGSVLLWHDETDGIYVFASLENGKVFNEVIRSVGPNGGFTLVDRIDVERSLMIEGGNIHLVKRHHYIEKAVAETLRTAVELRATTIGASRDLVNSIDKEISLSAAPQIADVFEGAGWNGYDTQAPFAPAEAWSTDDLVSHFQTRFNTRLTSWGRKEARTAVSAVMVRLSPAGR
jgi:hypothetical protein